MRVQSEDGGKWQNHSDASGPFLHCIAGAFQNQSSMFTLFRAFGRLWHSFSVPWICSNSVAQLALLRSTDAGPRSRPSLWRCPRRDRWPWPRRASSSWRATNLPPAVATKHVLRRKEIQGFGIPIVTIVFIVYLLRVRHPVGS